MISFLLHVCVVKVVESRANYQAYGYDVHFLQCHAFIFIYFVNGEGFC